MDRLGDMRLFVEAANMGSLSAAGRRLNLTPAAASARLQKLEAALHTRLFERTTRQLRLTEEGRCYLHFCRQALQAVDDGEAALQQGQNVVRGRLRLTAASDLGRHLLLDWLDEFGAAHPDVSFTLTLSDSLVNLLEDEIDVAVRFGELPDSACAARALAPSWRMACASPAFIAKYGEPVTPQDLVRLPCVVLSTASGPINEWRFTCMDSAARAGGPNSPNTQSVRVDCAHESNDGAITREWALRGYGIAYKSIWDIAADVRAARLKILMPAWRGSAAPLNAVYHRNRYLPPRVRALLDFLSDRFAQTFAEMSDVTGAAYNSGFSSAPR
jgi:DNA-binding transcriptional LysR family regulator